MAIGYDEVFPLWALSTPDVGGLGWGIEEIGKVGNGQFVVLCRPAYRHVCILDILSISYRYRFFASSVFPPRVRLSACVIGSNGEYTAYS